MDIGFLSGFQRVIRLKNVEAWDVTVTDQTCRIVIVDERRPSTDADFPWLEDGIGEEKRNNHISIYIFHSKELLTSEKTILYQVAEHLTDHVALAHCNVTVLFQLEAEYDGVLDRILTSKGYSSSDITALEKFFYFSQDG